MDKGLEDKVCSTVQGFKHDCQKCFEYDYERSIQYAQLVKYIVKHTYPHTLNIRCHCLGSKQMLKSVVAIGTKADCYEDKNI